ncbi:spore germination protein [Bacillus sp. YZJH907-2]|uniref:Spore germination protein n=2 Tax=Halalkalibacter suaedae TaxID=2822140 RepID=A0A940WTS2_9BACI|nr:spore germination protein [Bacillus suaedae]
MKVQDNMTKVKETLHAPSDLEMKEFTIGQNNHMCGLVCIDGLVDKDLIYDKVLKNIQLFMMDTKDYDSAKSIVTELENQVVTVTTVTASGKLDEIVQAILSGDTVLFVEDASEALIIGSKGWENRAISEPVTEAVVRGPRNGFTENLRTNMMQLRRQIRDPNLHFDSIIVGRRSKKEAVISYIGGIADPKVVEEFKYRIESIDIDEVLETGYIEQWIEDSFLSPFPQLQNTERPDRVAGSLLQGYVAVLLDGTPFALYGPSTLATTIQSPEDYYERWEIATLLRVVRYGAAFLATFLPAIYIALVSFHPGLIPSKLAFSIASTREGVPFPAVIEAFMMEITLELLREAGLRLPKPIGQTIGIVGGLVIGEAAVSAGIISPIMVIVVAITAISSFALPAYNLGISLRIIRFPIMVMSATFGLYGLIIAYIIINIHVANLKSFGVPYSTPFAPSLYSDWKDLVLRAPLTMLTKRPKMVNAQNTRRMDKGESSK